MRKISEIQTDFDKAMEEDRTDDGIRYALELNKATASAPKPRPKPIKTGF